MRSETTERQIAKLRYLQAGVHPTFEATEWDALDAAIDALLAQDDPQADADTLAAEVAEWVEDELIPMITPDMVIRRRDAQQDDDDWRDEQATRESVRPA